MDESSNDLEATVAKDTPQYDVLVVDKKTKMVKRKLGPYSLEQAQKVASGKEIDTTVHRATIAVHEIKPGETIAVDPDAPKPTKAEVAAAVERKNAKKEKSRGRSKKDD